MSVYLTARKASTDALATVSAASNTITASLGSLSALASTAAAHAEAYRKVSERTLEVNIEQRVQRSLVQAAADDALFYEEITSQFSDNPETERLFHESLAEYAKIDAKSVERINNKLGRPLSLPAAE